MWLGKCGHACSHVGWGEIGKGVDRLGGHVGVKEMRVVLIF